MSCTVGEIEKIMADLAPVETAEAYDNVGLLVGRRNAPVNRILVALDCTGDVVQEAKRLGAELIVSHHPLLFHARKNLGEEDPEGKILCDLVRAGISLIAAHTNLDQTNLSGSACCAKLLELKNLRQEGYLFFGDLAAAMTARSLSNRLTTLLSWPIRIYGNEDTLISSLAIAGGAYDEGWQRAQALGAQALLTGEVRHHNALSAVMSGFVLLDGGHYATEAPLVPVLAEYLQKRLNDVQYMVRVYPSRSVPFGCV